MSAVDLIGLGFMILGLLAAIVARALVAAARERARTALPDWYAALSGPGAAFRPGGPDERARRRLAAPLIFGPLPPAAAADPVMRRLARDVRRALGAVVGCLLAVALLALAGR